MKFIKATDYYDMSRKAANIISAQIIMKPNCTLGLATGSSPIGTYQQLIEWYRKGDLDFSEVKTINLDEYKGLGKDNHQSYYYFMYHNFYKFININLNNTHIPNGLAADDILECVRYNQVIHELGGIDLQLLGLGHNGHIGFNEPEQAFETDTHCIALSESTIAANARLFERSEDVPRYAYTMGVKTIMQAKKIVIIVSGEDKADIVKKAFFDKVTPVVPASIIQMHNDAIIVGDEAAFSKIELD